MRTRSADRPSESKVKQSLLRLWPAAGTDEERDGGPITARGWTRTAMRPTGA